VLVLSVCYDLLRILSTELHEGTAIAVGRETFRPDAGRLVELLIKVQSKYLVHFFLSVKLMMCAETPVDPSDAQIGHYLMSTWAKVCQALGPEFEPYLPVVMPGLLETASRKADVSVYGTLCLLPCD
jgi:importin-5